LRVAALLLEDAALERRGGEGGQPAHLLDIDPPQAAIAAIQVDDEDEAIPEAHRQRKAVARQAAAPAKGQLAVALHRRQGADVKAAPLAQIEEDGRLLEVDRVPGEGLLVDVVAVRHPGGHAAAARLEE